MGVGRWDVFVSYGHEDADWVGALAGNLHRDGFEVFLDQWELIGGDRFAGRLEDAIRGATNGVLVVSPHSLSRPWVQEEYAALLTAAVQDPARRRLIPVLYRDTELPPFLGNRSWVDFRSAVTGPEYETRLDELERYLRGQAAADRPERGGPRVWPAGEAGEVVRPAGAIRLSLVIQADQVSLRETGQERAQPAAGLRPSTVEAVRELHRVWARGWWRLGDELRVLGLDGMLADVGRRLGHDFLAGEVGAELSAAVERASALNEVLELGVQTPGLTDLPWETLVLPQADGTIGPGSGTPLALHRNVALYRELGGLGAAPAYKVRGPLRILVAIASPESQNQSGELLNYEAELARILGAVDPARRSGNAFVRVLTDGTTSAIRSALASDPECFHVLHLSCHARPGELILETDEGEEDAVSAQRLLDEALPAGVDLPMVVLSGCSTGLGARTGDSEAAEAREGERAFGAIATELLRAGVPSVLAMQSPVTDRYAAELTAAMYQYLATAEVPDPLLALNEARGAAERTRQALPFDAPTRGAAEWATPALWVRGVRLPLYNRHEPFGEIEAIHTPVLAEGIVVRKVGEFVGRRRELRVARRALRGSKAGVVVHGIGGVGKSTLAAELISQEAPGQLLVSLRGALSVDRILDEVGAQLSMQAVAGSPRVADQRAWAQRLRAADIEWSDRWRGLAEVILPAVPILVLLDNFEDNLDRDGSVWRLRDPEVAQLLSGWARRAGQSKLLITSRYPFELPERADRRIERLHLGPLSPAETAKLFWQLPGLDALSAADRLRAYRDVGGHARTLEYLDALLRGGQARFDDVAERMEQRLIERGIEDPEQWIATRDRDADSALAEAVTLAVDDVVLGDLLDAVTSTRLARELVIGASVYRVPVDDIAMVWQLAEETEPEPDPARDERIARVYTVLEAASEAGKGGEVTPADLGLTDEDIAAYEDDVEALRSPPVDTPDGFVRVLTAARAAGLIAPVTQPDAPSLHQVHRWTARAIAELEPALVGDAHRRAARYWRWRVEYLPQSESDDIDQLLEARYHHHTAGELDAALQLTEHAVLQLETWGQYGRASELCRETINWLPDGVLPQANYIHQLGILAQRRGDYETAEQRYTQALEINNRLRNEAGLANNYHQLGMLAQYRGEYETAERHYNLALEIKLRLGNQATLANSYHQLGILAQLRGDYQAAEQRYNQALEINDRIDNQPGLAHSYHQLGTLAQERGDYETAEQEYIKSLEIEQRLGNQSGLADSYHQLGILAQLREDYGTAEQRYIQGLEINERLGDQAGLASSYHQLGSLAGQRGDYETAEKRYLQSLEISQRLSDQAALAISYGSLGVLAEKRGDYDSAEQHYTRSLEISEQLGNRAGIAISYESLAQLNKKMGNMPASVRYDVGALALRFQLSDDRVQGSLGRLSHARRELGDVAFDDLAREILDDESVQALGDLLE